MRYIYTLIGPEVSLVGIYAKERTVLLVHKNIRTQVFTAVLFECHKYRKIIVTTKYHHVHRENGSIAA